MASWTAYWRRSRCPGEETRMALTGRAALVALAGVVVVLLAPLGGLMVLLVLLAICIGIVVDLALAASPRSLAIARGGDTSARVGEDARVVLTIRNPGARTARGWVRDAW